MKTFFITIFFLFTFSFLYAQKVIENPNTGIYSHPGVSVTKVELNSNATVLSFSVDRQAGTKVGIADKSYIMVVGQPDTLFMTKKEAPDTDSTGWYFVPEGGLTYRLFFPSINPEVAFIDFGEPVDNAWLIYDIEINRPVNKSVIPDALLGNWFSVENGNWSISFLNSNAIFNNQVWNYGTVTQNRNVYEIELIKDNNHEKLLLNPETAEVCLMSKNNETFRQYSKNPELYYKTLDYKEKNQKFNPGKVTYSGLIRNYRQEFGAFVSLSYRDKITGEEFAEVADIKKDGTFSIELSIDNPQEINVRILGQNENIYVIPGRNLFQIVNSGSTGFYSLFMGDSAPFTLRLRLLKKLRENIEYQNRLNVLSDEEYFDLILSASVDKINSFTKPVLTDIKSENNMFLIPRRSLKIEQGYLSSSSIWISNEITNKQYREFTMDIISNPNNILKWQSSEYNPLSGAYEQKTNVQIFSEVAKNLIDSTREISVFYKSEIVRMNIKEYFNNKEFDNYPVVGVPLKAAEYYCYWLNQKNDITNLAGYRLPSETQLRVTADYLREVTNYKKLPGNLNGLNVVPGDTLAYLNNNAPEWYKVVRYPDRTKLIVEMEDAILLEWIEFGDSIKVEINNENELNNAAGFRIVISDNVTTKQLNKSQLKFIILLLTLLLFLVLGFLFWKWRVRQRFRREQQHRRLRELELTAIRSQMNPHFLFNSLNSVQNLVQQNKGREAHLYLAEFAGLIRKVLQNSDKEEVSLAEELEMVQQYLNLEKLRFDFDFSISVPDNVDANNTMIPSLMLQPFAENAVIHGLQHKQGKRYLKINVSRENSGIKIEIEDNGIGRNAAKQFATEKNGKSSKLMKERLEILQQKQGEKYNLEIIDINGEQTGTRVEITIPEEK